MFRRQIIIQSPARIFLKAATQHIPRLSISVTRQFSSSTASKMADMKIINSKDAAQRESMVLPLVVEIGSNVVV